MKRNSFQLETVFETRLQLHRLVASELARCLASVFLSLDMVDDKIGREHGWTKRFMSDLLDGMSPPEGIDGISDIALACGYVVRLDLEPIEPSTDSASS